MPSEQYIYHITVNTGHKHYSRLQYVDGKVVKLMQRWVADMIAGKQYAMTQQGNTACRIGQHNGKMAEFILAAGPFGRQTDILRFVVCRHSAVKTAAWTLAGGQGEPPTAPFLAANILVSGEEMMALGVTMDDIMMFADFERCLAWGWMAYRQAQTAAKNAAQQTK